MLEAELVNALLDWGESDNLITMFTGKRRHSCTLDVVCWPPSDRAAPYGPLRTRNISLGGIAFLCQDPFDVGSLWDIEVRSSFGTILEPRPSRVVHATAQASGQFLVGCEFLVHLEARVLREMLMP